MSAHQHRVCVWMSINGFLESLGQVFLKRRVLNDGNPQRVMIIVHSFSFALGDALDLLDITDFKIALLAILPLDQQSHENGPLRVRMDTAHGSAFKGSEEQRRAVRRLEVLGFANVFALGRWVSGGWEFHHEYVLRLNQLLLNS